MFLLFEFKLKNVKTNDIFNSKFESEQQLQDQLNLNLKNEMSRLKSEQDLELKKIMNQYNLEKYFLIF